MCFNMTLRELEQVCDNRIAIRVAGFWKTLTLPLLDIYGDEKVSNFYFNTERESILVHLFPSENYSVR